jgi:hypothetical protein
MNFDQVILELYRLAETRDWGGQRTEEALRAAIEGMEQLWEQKQAEKRKQAVGHANRKQPRIWC